MSLIFAKRSWQGFRSETPPDPIVLVFSAGNELFMANISSAPEWFEQADFTLTLSDSTVINMTWGESSWTTVSLFTMEEGTGSLSQGGNTISVIFNGATLPIKLEGEIEVEPFSFYGNVRTLANNETKTLLDAMDTMPDFSRIIGIDNLISALKLQGYWIRMDGFYMFHAHTQQAALLNWIQPGILDATLPGNIFDPSFTVDYGFYSNGAASINIVIPSDYSKRYTLTDACAGIIINEKPDTTGQQMISGSMPFFLGTNNSNSSLFNFFCNSSASGELGGLGAVSGRNIWSIIRNGNTHAIATATSTALGGSGSTTYQSSSDTATAGLSSGTLSISTGALQAGEGCKAFWFGQRRTPNEAIANAFAAYFNS